MPSSLPVGPNRRLVLSALAALPLLPELLGAARAQAQTAPLASWNDGAAKQAIVDFVRATTDQREPKLRAAGGAHRDLRPGRHALGRASDVLAGALLPGSGAGGGQGEAGAGERRAVQDRAVRRPRGDREALDARPRKDPRRDADRHVGGRVRGGSEEMARRPPRTRAGSGPTPSSPTSRCRRCCNTCAPTATRPTSSPAAARISCASIAEQVYGIPPEQVVGTAGGTKYGYDKDGKPFLTKEPKLLLNDNDAGKPEGIHLMIGRRPACGVRQLDRRPADAGIHQGRRRRAAGDARAARRREARIRLRPGARACPTPRSAPSPRRSTTRRRRTAGPSSA